MDKLHCMRIVVAIADSGSLTAAADHLDTSLPTVVRVLSATERELGIRLFERTTRQVRITEEGSLYVEASRRILGQVTELEDALRDRRTEPAGLLTITAPVLFGRLHVTPILNAFLQEYPRVSARLILVDRVVDLIEEGIDVAVRIGNFSAQDLVISRVGSVRRCLCAAPALLETIGPVDHPAALQHAPFVRFLGLMQSHRLSFAATGALNEVELSNMRMTSNQIDACITACLDGLGVGMFLSYQIQPAVSAGRLRIILEEFEPEPLPVALVYSPTKRLSARSREFIAWAKKRLTVRLEYAA